MGVPSAGGRRTLKSVFTPLVPKSQIQMKRVKFNAELYRPLCERDIERSATIIGPNYL
jgi:hypothetical protein